MGCLGGVTGPIIWSTIASRETQACFCRATSGEGRFISQLSFRPPRTPLSEKPPGGSCNLEPLWWVVDFVCHLQTPPPAANICEAALSLSRGPEGGNNKPGSWWWVADAFQSGPRQGVRVLRPVRRLPIVTVVPHLYKYGRRLYSSASLKSSRRKNRYVVWMFNNINNNNNVEEKHIPRTEVISGLGGWRRSVSAVLRLSRMLSPQTEPGMRRGRGARWIEWEGMRSGWKDQGRMSQEGGVGWEIRDKGSREGLTGVADNWGCSRGAVLLLNPG